MKGKREDVVARFGMMDIGARYFTIMMCIMGYK